MPRRSPVPKKRRRRGAQPGNSNAATHGFYAAPPSNRKLDTIDAIIEDTQTRQAQLSAYIDAVMAEGATIDDVVKLIALQAQNASRLGRLLRDQRALSGESADSISAAIGIALDELSTQLGVKL